jgi:hypothetical protein
MERINIDMREASLSISKECRSEISLAIITLIFVLPTETSITTWHKHVAITFSKIVVATHSQDWEQ